MTSDEKPTNFDPKSLKNKDGNYAPWLTGREVKKLKKVNNKKKTQIKNKKRAAEKKIKSILNSEKGRNQVEELKQEKLDSAMDVK